MNIKTLTDKLANLSFFSISLLLHVILVGLLGTVAIVRTIQDDPQVFVATDAQSFISDEAELPGPPSEEEVEFEEMSFSTDVAVASAPTAQLSALATDATTNYSSFTVNVAGATQSTGVSMTGSNIASNLAMGAVAGGRGGRGGGLRTGTLFGVEVTATQLGVILDVSGSAHPHLSAALTEIDKNFSDAIILLNPGCGMRETVTDKMFEIIPLGRGMRAMKANKNDDAFRQISNGMKKHDEVDKYIGQLARRGTVYVVNNNPDRRDHMISGTHLAFENLIKQGVDTIYWFADFADNIDQKIADDLSRDLRKRGIKLIAHNFAGKPVRKEAESMVKATGGTSISEIPGKK